MDFNVEVTVCVPIMGNFKYRTFIGLLANGLSSRAVPYCQRIGEIFGAALLVAVLELGNNSVILLCRLLCQLNAACGVKLGRFLYGSAAYGYYGVQECAFLLLQTICSSHVRKFCIGVLSSCKE